MVLVIALLDDKDRRNVDEALALVSWNIFLALTYVCRSFVGILRYSNCGESSAICCVRFVIVARTHCCKLFLSSLFLGCRIAISTYGTSTFHAIALFEWGNSGLISCLYFIKSALFIFETGISHQRSDICGSLTFMSLFYFLLHRRPTCYRKSTIARSWLRYRIAPSSFSCYQT